MLERILRVALVLTVLPFASLGVARGDVGPAPSCPTGQTSSYYQGRYCSPTPCTDETSCGAGAVCAERGLCVQARGGADPGIPKQALGECDSQSDCLGSATCERGLFCGPRVDGTSEATTPVPAEASVAGSTTEPASSTTPSSGGCGGRGCGVAASGTPGIVGFVVALCLAIVLVRRARS